MNKRLIAKRGRFHPTLSKKGRFFFAPIIKFCEYLGKHHPSLMVQLRFFAVFKRFANLKHPKDLNEKILYLKLYKDTSAWPDLVDKYKVREYISSKNLDETLVKLFGVWYSTEGFLQDYDSLPKSFILKANNGDGKGTNRVVRNKADENREVLAELVSSWLSRKNIGALVAEPQYDSIVPCVIAEELLPLEEGHQSLTDYKIWCFNGRPFFIWVCNDRNADGNSAHVLTYDTSWKAHPEYSVFTSDYLQGEPIPKPINFERMLEVAALLSEGFPEVRVDLYNTYGKVYFGELTFTSQGGINSFYTQDFLDYTGSLFEVENLPNREK